MHFLKYKCFFEDNEAFNIFIHSKLLEYLHLYVFMFMPVVKQVAHLRFVIARLFSRINMNNCFQWKCMHMRLENRSEYKNATSLIFKATRLSLKLNETCVFTLINAHMRRFSRIRNSSVCVMVLFCSPGAGFSKAFNFNLSITIRCPLNCS